MADSPVEQPDGTLRCKRHGLEICGKCCVDYTFMRDIIEEAKSDMPFDDADPEGDPIGGYGGKGEKVPTRRLRCVVCRKDAPHQCSRCHVTYYCGKEDQKKDWKKHKTTCKKANPTEQNRPSVLAIALGGEYDVVDGIADGFFSTIEPSVDIFEAQNPTAAIKGLHHPRVPIAVLFMSSINPRAEEHVPLLTALIKYAKNERGIIIFGFGFPSFMRANHFQEVFERFGVYWKSYNYRRETFHLNNVKISTQQGINNSSGGDEGEGEGSQALQRLLYKYGQTLPQSFSIKALQVTGVSAEDAVYVGEGDLIDKPKGRVKEKSLVSAAAAITNVGKGRIAYLGDVNSEWMTELLVRAMIGLEPGSPSPDD
ncbi:hypothetical protein FRC16_009164 [Serendipita sp. 398]|nr:hypothetical protein FRC16_009164 [Serendipita sp. 398]